MEALRAAVTMILGIALPLAIQLWDRRRLPPPLARRTWGYATWGGAVYAFGPFSMLGWIFVTRAPWRRCLVAVPFTLAPLVGLAGIDLAMSRLANQEVELEVADLALELGVAAVLIAVVMLVVELIVRGWRRLRRRPGPDVEWEAIARELRG